MRSIVLFGGSFDPVHAGHLILARCALQQLKADELWFVPCAQSADGKRLAPAALRLAGLRAAVLGQPGFKVWDGELKRGGVSRTVDTLRVLQRPDCRFWLALGDDQWERFYSWKEPKIIKKLSKIAIFGRNSELKAESGVVFIQSPRLAISSSEIRRRLKAGQACFDRLPPRLSPALLKAL